VLAWPDSFSRGVRDYDRVYPWQRLEERCVEVAAESVVGGMRLARVTRHSRFPLCAEAGARRRQGVASTFQDLVTADPPPTA
jgi:hypothetical protein